jgi:Ca-activated chloride channel family protein
MSYTKPNRRWGTLVFLGGVIAFAAILTPWCQLLPGLGPCGTDPGTPTPSGGTQPPAVPEGAVDVYFYSSNTKQNWIEAVTASFNEAEFKTSLGHPIFVRVKHGTSGGSQLDILNGVEQPQAWSPGDQSWVDTANEDWQIDHPGETLIPDDCQATVYAPIGFAMWRHMAEAMGWPNEPIGWAEIVELAADPQGWGRYGHPEWGQFQFGHTHPTYSNSGLLIMTALVHDTLQQTEPLAAEQVFSPAVLDAMGNVERHTYHYGEQSRDLIGLMVRRGPSYLHAVNTTEAETLKTNVERGSELQFPLAFIFPASGTYWTEQPYCVLKADWVSEEQAEAARIYGDYLLQPDQQRLTVENYLRPVDAAIGLGCPICLEQGTDPGVTAESRPALASPAVDVAESVKAAFLQTKKKATVILVLDISSSMQEGDRLTHAVSATVEFLGRLHPEDEVMVLTFDTQVMQLQPPGLSGDVSESLAQTLRGLYPRGNTALYDAVCEAMQQANALKAQHEAEADNRLYGVVLLSDGENTAGSISEEQMMATCLPSGEDAEGIKIFAIAYGDGADTEVLQRISIRTNGKLYSGDPGTIEKIYNSISAEQ